MKESEKNEEIEELKKRIEVLENYHNSNLIYENEGPEDLEDYGEQKYKNPEKLMPDKRGKYSQILVILIVIIVLLDIVFAIAIYHPNLNFNNSSGDNPSLNSEKCSDGTPADQCSKDRPFYCYEGNLIKKAATCGCPNGYAVRFQDCARI